MRKPPENWFDHEPTPAQIASGKRLGAIFPRIHRADTTPKDSILKIEAYYKSLRREGLWDDPARTLRFLALCRNPKISISEMIPILREEFNEPRFTKGTLSGRLDRLRKIGKRFHAKDSKPKCHGSTTIEE